MYAIRSYYVGQTGEQKQRPGARAGAAIVQQQRAEEQWRHESRA